MNESRAIQAYLCNAYDKDGKLYPTDAKVRARVDQRLCFEMLLYNSMGELVFPHIFGKPVHDIEAKQKKFEEVLGWANDFVKLTGFFAETKEMTIADIAIAATFGTLKAFKKFDLEPYPDLNAWYEKMTKLVKKHEELNQVGIDQFAAFLKTKWP